MASRAAVELVDHPLCKKIKIPYTMKEPPFDLL